MRYFKVRNLAKFQHYSERCPPWIKLHQSVTDDTGFALLPDEAKGHLMLIWLLASRMENRLPFDPVFIGARINARGPVDLECLVNAGFLILIKDECEQRASETLASRKQAASAALENEPLRRIRDLEQRESTEQSRGERATPPALPPGAVADQPSKEPLAVRTVFGYWQKVMGHPTAQLTPKRRSKIVARLKDSTVDECLRAIDGCKASPHHMGQNDTETVYDDLELILRSRDKVEFFMSKVTAKPRRDVFSPGDEDPEERIRREMEADQAREGE